MSDNRFADCETVMELMARVVGAASTACHGGTGHAVFNGALARSLTDDAVARIRELAPPPTVSEEARERAVKILRDERWEMNIGSRQTVDHIIDALGYTPAPEPDVVPIERVITTGRCPRKGCGSTPFVDLTPNELRHAATVVETFGTLHSATIRMADGVQPTWPVPIIDAQLPVRVVCSDDCDWVLRIGGEQ